MLNRQAAAIDPDAAVETRKDRSVAMLSRVTYTSRGVNRGGDRQGIG